jgi:FKBP-type peptidyl-prolyl cis-trans isomerase FkpA
MSHDNTGRRKGGAELRMTRARHIIRVAAIGAALGALAACGGGGNSSPTSPSTPRGEYSQTDLRIGTGADAVSLRRLTVNYTGWLYDPARPEQKGSQFDTSVGRQPFSFTLGAGQVIRGWDQGVAGMKVGGQRRLVLPPELGYGSAGSPPAIPPNATLVFDIELLDVQ